MQYRTILTSGGGGTSKGQKPRVKSKGKVSEKVPNLRRPSFNTGRKRFESSGYRYVGTPSTGKHVLEQPNDNKAFFDPGKSGALNKGSKLHCYFEDKPG